MKRFVLMLMLLIPVLQIAHAADYDQSVLRVKTTEEHAPPGVSGWGSAVAVDLSAFGYRGAQYLLSAAHVVKDCARIEVEVAGRWRVATVELQDEDYDLCILKIDASAPSLELDQTVPLDVIGVGYKWGKKPGAVSTGLLIARSTNHNKAQWRAALSISPGCSGGAVLSTTGHVVGIVIAGISDGKGGMRDDTTIFVPCPVVRRWLEECHK